MCGIFAYLGNRPPEASLYSFSLIKHRGPDYSCYKEIAPNVVFGHHRLCINDLTANGHQPLEHDGVFLICNGEIYNHKELEKTFQITTKSKSDCEVILHLYKKIGIEETLKQLDGVFAFVLHNARQNITIVARDPIGVRPLFIGTTSTSWYFASEAKAIEKHCTRVDQFKPGTFWTTLNQNYIQYWDFPNPCLLMDTRQELKQINKKLKAAVKKRIQNSERPIGLLLSGGFDSSIVAAIAQNIGDHQFHTFSVGFHDSNDLAHARAVAEKIGSKHHEIRYTLNEALEIIPEVIQSLESYDVTTVRASVPMWLLARYVAKNTDIRVLLSGEGADEYGSYIYFKDAPSPIEFQKESFRLIEELHYYDVLRTDRCTAAHGLEVRVPFLDLDFMRFFTLIDIKYRMPYHGIEKYFLRKAFESDDLLPLEVLWRKKDAFSDSVGGSWRKKITDHVNKRYSDSQLVIAKTKYTHVPPMTKEGLWYREMFEHYFTPTAVTLIPRYWMPKWQPATVIDPSATVLKSFITLKK